MVVIMKISLGKRENNQEACGYGLGAVALWQASESLAISNTGGDGQFVPIPFHVKVWSRIGWRTTLSDDESKERPVHTNGRGASGTAVHDQSTVPGVSNGNLDGSPVGPCGSLPPA